jgi:folylpolyglutamate synthase/dihydropteroate synthase
MQTADLMKFLPQGFVKDNVYQTETVEKALETAKKISSAEDLICVTGSLYLVGEAQRLLIESNEKRAFA